MSGSVFKKAVRRCFARFGFQIERISDPSNILRPWRDAAQAEFQQIFGEILVRTIVEDVRCFVLYELAVNARTIPGSAAEIGVYKGGTARLLARVLSPVSKTLHIFDTFTGMPPVDPRLDQHRQGDFGDASLESVRGFLADLENVRIFPGTFPDTATAIRDERFCLVHVDADIYSSVRDCCAFFYERMNPGGVFVFDDYGCPACPGAKVAVDEFFRERDEKTIYLPTGQALVIKR
jgi:O-methyltransferase